MPAPAGKEDDEEDEEYVEDEEDMEVSMGGGRGIR